MKEQTKDTAPERHTTKRRRGSKKKRARRGGAIRSVLMAVFFLGFCYSAFRLGKDIFSDFKAQRGFDELSAIVSESAAQNTASAQNAADASASAAGKEPGAESAEDKSDAEPVYAPLAEYARLHEMNEEFFGWLKIEGLEIDYPVMYAPTRSEYYLNRDFYGEYSVSGIPFVDGRCPAEGNYYLIYGHLMKNKTIFGRLPQYEDEQCWRENPVITFDTVYEHRQYAVMACFLSKIYAVDEVGFRYYTYFDLRDEDTFNEYVSQVMAASLYDTGVRASWGDELLVLTTCSEHVSDGRFVLVAKRIA